MMKETKPMNSIFLKAIALASVVIGSFTHAVSAETNLIDGLRTFICDGENFILQETEGGWTSPTWQQADIRQTIRGWRIEDLDDGWVGFLQQDTSNDWKAQVLSEDGYEQFDCYDTTSNTAKIIEVIDPLLAINFRVSQEQLADTNAQLATARDSISRLTASSPAERNLLFARIERLCIWMKTYGHLDVLEKTFPFGDEQYMLCE